MRRLPSRRRLLGWTVLLAATALTVRVLLNSQDELLAAADNLSSVQPGWLVLAVAFEGLAYVCYGAAQRLLFRRGGADVGLAPMTAISVVGQAAGNCLPGGLALTAVVMYRQLRRRGVEDVLTGWVLTVMSVLFMAALALVAIVAIQIAGPNTPVPGLRTASLSVVGLVVLAALGGRLLRGHASWGRWGLLVLSLVGRLPILRDWLNRRDVDLSFSARALAARLGTVRLGWRALLVATGLLMLSWLADALVLGLAFTALGTTPPLRGLLLAYCAGQLAAALPITPGGLGVVEGSLTLALVAFGGAEAGTLSAVLLYRLVSFWAILPAGAGCWVGLHRTARSATTKEGSP
ncbi:MAG: YbhN family protein [Actinomycetota bacterium]|nr:YbhN family protein [Actinomycetota bacterium]